MSSSRSRFHIGWRIAVVASVVVVWASALGVFALYKSKTQAEEVAVVPVIVPEPIAPKPEPPPEPIPEPLPLTIVIPIPVTPPPKPIDLRPFWAKDVPSEIAGVEVEACQTFGTAVKFTRTAHEAMVRANHEDKLLYVLHLSGNLEDDGFT